VGIAASSGLDLTTRLSCVAAVYALTALVFRVPVPVQPMKAMAAAIIALGIIAGWAVLVLLRRTHLHRLDLPWPGVARRLAPAPEPAELKAP